MKNDIFSETDYQSLVNIMAFFDWEEFDRLESLASGLKSGDKALDIDAIKEYVIETFEELVELAKEYEEDYRWTEGSFKLRFEYRKGIGLRLMYVPVSEGDD